MQSNKYFMSLRPHVNNSGTIDIAINNDEWITYESFLFDLWK